MNGEPRYHTADHHFPSRSVTSPSLALLIRVATGLDDWAAPSFAIHRDVKLL